MSKAFFYRALRLVLRTALLRHRFGLTQAQRSQTIALLMRTKAAQILIVFSLVVTLGGHWALLQSIAWISMFARFSQTTSLARAWTKTFDGNHPCKLCLVVQTGKKSEKNQESVLVVTKLDLFVLNIKPFATLRCLSSSDRFPALSQSAPERFERPPTPPPRMA